MTKADGIFEATLDDFERLVSSHLRVFGSDENLAVRLGPPYVRAVYRWFLTSRETAVLVANVGGELAAWTTLCDRPYSEPMFRATSGALVRGALLHPSSLFHPEILRRASLALRRRPLGGRSLKDPDGLAFLAYIATLPEYRGRGLGPQLLEAAKITCRRRGATYLRSGLFRSNDRSLRMFQSAGFMLLDEPRTATHAYVQAKLQDAPTANSSSGSD
jgi:ribosomal protein S18 acetylase RimI-like enzyme